MKIFSSKKVIITIVYFLVLINFCYNECNTHSFTDILYPKALTLDSGYHVMVTSKGIISFYPKLTNVYFSYNFTESQKMSTRVHTNDMTKSVNQNEISQFSKAEGEYIIIIANYYIYLLNEKGKMIFNQDISNNINAERTLSLVAYKYTNNNYYFIIAYNTKDDTNTVFLSLYYYCITKYSNSDYRIELETEKKHYFNEILHLNGLSCQYMFLSNHTKVLTCFESLKEGDNYNSCFFI